MATYEHIANKIHQFVRKYYMNELIKGGILFFSLGCLYFIFTLFVEYFLWLNPLARTFLFWLFFGVELFLCFRFIFVPIFKLIGLQKGLGLEESSKIIGSHFPEISDKLINIIQLKERLETSDLLVASIEQKAKEIQPIPFANAVNFKTNFRYIKYALIPVFIYITVWVSGNLTIFESSLDRVVHYRTAYSPPAPFSFLLSNNNLEVIEGKSIVIEAFTKGELIPSETKIFFNDQSYFMQNKGINEFAYNFSNVSKPIDFFVEANGIRSQNYRIEVIKTPTIQNLTITLSYPSYLNKKNEEIRNTGNFTIPEGTLVKWKAKTKQTDSVSFTVGKTRNLFDKIGASDFEFQQQIRKQLSYEISTSNEALSNFETLQFDVKIVPDAYPELEVLTVSDSLRGVGLEFAGRTSDDYGIRRLELVYFKMDDPNTKYTKKMEVPKGSEFSFYEEFPGELELEEGSPYGLYFQVFDNDGVNGSKKTLSKEFSFRKKTKEEIGQEALEFQRNQIQNIEKSIQKQQIQNKNLEEIEQNLQNTKDINWSDKKKIDQFIKRQEQYKQMMLRQADQLQKNLDQQPDDPKNIQDKKETLKERIEELKKLDEEQKILEELKKLANKLNKEDLLKKVQKLATQNKQEERSLERILELTKRFYVEQKTMQIASKLDQLAKKQDELMKKEKDSVQEQKVLSKEFEEIKKELNTLEEDNKALKKPISIPETKDQQEKIQEALKESEDTKTDKNEKKKSQRKAAKELKDLSKQLQSAMMQMEGEMQEANEESLRIILENLLNFSFQQEHLMDQFSKIDVTHPDFGKELKNQNNLKTYFEHIDDSLYVLSMRLPEISVKIQTDLTEAHYNINQSLANFADNRFNNGVSNQQYVMTSVNNLADFLSDILNNMQQPKNPASGKGKKGGKEFSLPDLIQKQQNVIEKMKEGKNQQGDKKGEQKKEGSGEGDVGEEMDENLYQIYQEQSTLREAFKDAMKEGSGNSPEAQKIIKSMEQLENEILEKGFNPGTIERMQQLQYNLLKLEKASFEQGQDKERKSKTNERERISKNRELFIQKLFYNQIEILNRQSLPLQKNYKTKVQEYFKKYQEKSSND